MSVFLAIFLTKLKYPRQIFQKILKYPISLKSVQWEPTCSVRTNEETEGLTDGHDEAKSRFSQFCERA